MDISNRPFYEQKGGGGFRNPGIGVCVKLPSGVDQTRGSRVGRGRKDRGKNGEYHSLHFSGEKWGEVLPGTFIL